MTITDLAATRAKATELWLRTTDPDLEDFLDSTVPAMASEIEADRARIKELEEAVSVTRRLLLSSKLLLRDIRDAPHTRACLMLTANADAACSCGVATLNKARRELLAALEAA